MPTRISAFGSMHYEISGEPNRDVLVLINSLGSDLRIWEKVLPKFEDHYRVLRYDLPGHGRGSGFSALHSIEQLGSDLLLLLDCLGLGQVCLCGISLGGLIAMHFAIENPQRVRRLILVNTSPQIGTPEGWQERIALVGASGMFPIANATVDRWFTKTYQEKHPAEMQTVCEMVLSTQAGGYAACCQVLRDADPWSRITCIEVPTLVVAGKHDCVTSPSQSETLRSMLRNSEYLELDASHLSAWEQHTEFAEAVLAFLPEEVPHHG